MKIEAGIPIPDDQRQQWPFMKMAPGESVLVTDAADHDKARMAARKAASRKKMHCVCRMTPDGLRIWIRD